MQNLVIVESPSKSKTIEKYLGPEYKVVASMGHIRDLATTGKFGLGVDVDKDFAPTYIPIKGKKKILFIILDQADSVFGVALVVWMFYPIGIEIYLLYIVRFFNEI